MTARSSVARGLARLSLLTLALLVLAPAAARAQTTVGAIRGRVTEASGTPIRGATVEIARYRFDDWRGTVTDEQGNFHFPALQPGRYEVRARRIGFRNFINRDVFVYAGQVRQVPIVLSDEAAVLDTVTATGESPVQISRANTEYTTRLDEKAVDLLPSAPDPTDLVKYTPGARPGQVWGGSTSQANNYQIDGVAANHPGEGGDLIPLSVNWIESVEIRGLGAGAEHGNFQGGLVNLVTKSGTNDFQGALRGTWDSQNLAASNLAPGEVGTEVESRMDFEGEIRGPLLRDRLFYYIAGQHFQRTDRTNNQIPAFNSRFAAPQERTETRLFGKLTFTPTRRDELNATLSVMDATADRFGQNGYQAPEAAWRMTAPKRFYNASWRHVFGERAFAEARVAGYSIDERRDGYAGADVPSVEAYGRDPARSYQNSVLRFRRKPESLGATLGFGFFARAFGIEHEVKAGGEYSGGTWLDQRLRNGGMTWRAVAQGSRFDPQNPATWRFAGFIPAEYGGEVDLNAEVMNAAVYLQDHVSFGDRLSVTAGLRWGWWRGDIVPGFGTGSRFTAVKDFAVEPRIGVTLDITGDNSFVAKGHWGIYHQNMFAQFYDRVEGGNVFTNQELWYYYGSPFTDPSTTFTPEQRDANQGFTGWQRQQVVTLNETGPVENYKQPYIAQWTAGLEKTFGSHWKAEAVFVSRRNHNMVGLVDRNMESNYTRIENVWITNTRGDTIRYLGSSPLGLPVVYIPNNALIDFAAQGGSLPKALTPQQLANLSWNPDYALTTLPGAKRDFRQMQFNMNASYPRWGGSFSVVMTSLKGNVDNVSGYDDPETYSAGAWVHPNERINFEGPLENYSARELKVHIYGDFKYGIRAGLYWNHATGDRYEPHYTFTPLENMYFPGKVRFDTLQAQLLLPVAGQRVRIQQRGNVELDPVTTIDFHLERPFKVGPARWTLTLDAFNLLGYETVTEYNASVNYGINYVPFIPSSTDPNSYYRAVRERVAPRAFRIGSTVYF